MDKIVSQNQQNVNHETHCSIADADRLTGRLSAEQRRQREILQEAEAIFRSGLQSMKYAGMTQDGQRSYSLKMGGYFPDNTVSTDDVAIYEIKNFNNKYEVIKKIREKLKETTSSLGPNRDNGRYRLKEKDVVSFVENSVSQNQQNVNSEIRYSISNADSLKEKQLRIIWNANPMNDDCHTGVRDIGDMHRAIARAFGSGLLLCVQRALIFDFLRPALR